MILLSQAERGFATAAVFEGIVGWKEGARAGGSGRENGLTLRVGLRIYREEINPLKAKKITTILCAIICNTQNYYAVK